MSLFEMIKIHINKTVPFAALTGVEIEEIREGAATTKLAQRDEIQNHLGTHHAGALFTLGEAASGAAMAGGFVDDLSNVRPVAANAVIAYQKIAKGLITAKASVDGDLSGLRAALDAAGKVQFPIKVDMTDEEGEKVAEMTVDWHIRLE